MNRNRNSNWSWFGIPIHFADSSKSGSLNRETFYRFKWTAVPNNDSFSCLKRIAAWNHDLLFRFKSIVALNRYSFRWFMWISFLNRDLFSRLDWTVNNLNPIHINREKGLEKLNHDSFCRFTRIGNESRPIIRGSRLCYYLKSISQTLKEFFSVLLHELFSSQITRV